VATREAFGATLVKLGEANPRVVVLDADVKNSTYRQVRQEVPERFFEIFIAEQNMIGISSDWQPGQDSVCSHLRLFLTRPTTSSACGHQPGEHQADGLPCRGIHRRRRRVADGTRGSGHDGRQPGVVVLYPSDAVCNPLADSASRGPPRDGVHPHRTPKTPILYKNDERFTIGGAKVCGRAPRTASRWSPPAVTVFEALKAHDELAKQGIAIGSWTSTASCPSTARRCSPALARRNNLILTSRTITRTVAWAMPCWPQSTPTREGAQARRDGDPAHGKAGAAPRPLRHQRRHIVDKVKKLVS